MNCEQKVQIQSPDGKTVNIDNGTWFDHAQCPHEATCSFEWVGQGRLAACPMHGMKARAVAHALGFELKLEPVALREVEVAQAVLEAILPRCLCAHKAHPERACREPACGCQIYRTGCVCGHDKAEHLVPLGPDSDLSFCKACGCNRYQEPGDRYVRT